MRTDSIFEEISNRAYLLLTEGLDSHAWSISVEGTNKAAWNMTYHPRMRVWVELIS